MATEAELQTQVADYLRLQYPDVLFHSDFGSGVKLTPGQAARQKRQNGERFVESDQDGLMGENYFGLFLELKKEGTRLKKKNGDWATKHIAEQAKVLEDLRERGYCTGFIVGFDEAKKVIDEYLGG